MFVKPGYLDAVSGEAWDRIVEECNAVGAKLAGKFDVLERYAVTYEKWRECQAAVSEEGQTVVSVRKESMVTERNPRMVDLHQLTAALGRLRAELGLAPTKTKPAAAGQTKSMPANDEPAEVIYKFPRC